MVELKKEPAKIEAMVIGVSAGAMEALTKLLLPLPENYPLPIIVVVHLPPDKKSVFAELFDVKSKLKVCEALDKEPIEAGHIYFAPPDYHLLVEKGKYLSLSTEEPLLFSRPSIRNCLCRHDAQSRN
jgi:two-component system chemotaxis response regulator CheB